jgi:hypothetical protein
MLGMRRDLNASESKHLAEFEFPLIIPEPDLAAGDDDVLDFLVRHLVDVYLTRQPAA